VKAAAQFNERLARVELYNALGAGWQREARADIVVDDISHLEI
jgi:hypothetical protein